jgi:uncharacterized membrane protein
MVWLGLVARSFYQQQLGFLMAPRPNWFVAILFYLLFIAGLLFFVVLPGLTANSLKATLFKARHIWPDHLRHLRPHQPCHSEELARAAQHR